jgi:hypothetical protein
MAAEYGCVARIVVVTGGNNGIGLEVCRQLAVNSVTVVLTARNETRGAAAVDKLEALGSLMIHSINQTFRPISYICLLVEYPHVAMASKPIILIKTIISLHILSNNSNFIYHEHHKPRMWGYNKNSFKFKSSIIKLIFPFVSSTKQTLTHLIYVVSLAASSAYLIID